MIKNHMSSNSKKLSSLYILLILMGCLASPVLSEPDYSKTPIFFIHGHGMSASCWNNLISYLRRCGYPTKYIRAIQLYPNTGANIDAAENQIASAVENLLREINKLNKKKSPGTGLKTKVDLISHSMGALSARWYAAKIHSNRVRIWLSLGGANHGTNVLCGWSDPGAQDLCPAYANNAQDSLIQYLLNGKPYAADIDETPYGLGKDSSGVNSIPPDDTRSILYISIRTSPDKWIEPEESAILDGAGGLRISIPKNVKAEETSLGNIKMLSGEGHDEMLSNEDTMKLIKAVICAFEEKFGELKQNK